MSEFSHSIVLFCGDDGLPLEFNIRNTQEKALLKNLIEHGGGICSQSSNAVHLISHGTKILNADVGKKLVSAKYIFDCVEKNYLLDVNNYVSTIVEARTSDISDDSNTATNVFPANVGDDIESEVLVRPEQEFLFAPQLSNAQQNSTSSESFVENSIDETSNRKSVSNASCGFVTLSRDRPLASTGKFVDDDVMELTCLNIEGLSPILGGDKFSKPTAGVSGKPLVEMLETPRQTVVSSSQPEQAHDEFDLMILNKSRQNNAPESEESLSQSYTVSSSADAQAAKSNSADKEHNSSEVFAITDSPLLFGNTDQITDSQAYLQNLEEEVERVLQKPSPKSIQDKICLVRYICVVKKLPPATVLELLNNL